MSNAHRECNRILSFTQLRGICSTTLVHMSDEADIQAGSESSSSDRAVAWLHNIDEKVNAMREEREQDPDSMVDKLIKFAIPTVASMVAGKLLQTVWNKGLDSRRNSTGNEEFGNGIMMAAAFAAISAAVGTVVTQLSNRGSQAFVARKQQRHNKKSQ